VRRAGLEEVQGGSRVLAHRARGVGPRTGWVRHPGEVQHRVASGHQLADGRIAGVDAVRIDGGSVRADRAVGPGHRHHVVPALPQEQR
jgi:hypothetical protein